MNESGPGMGTMAKSTVVTWPLIQHILIYFTPFWPGKAMCGHGKNTPATLAMMKLESTLYTVFGLK